MTRYSLLFSAFTVCLSQVLPSQLRSVPGDNFCSNLMCVTAFVNTSTVTYQMSALNQLGWMAMGFGTQMTDARMVIMWSNSDGTVTLSQRTATGLIEPVMDPSPPRKATTFIPLTTLAATSKRLSFTVPKDGTTLQNAVWALGFTNPMSTLENATLEIHIDAGNFSLDLTKTMDIEDDPESTSSQTTSPSTSSISPTQTSPSNGPSSTTSGRLVIAHSILSVFGFIFLLPMGALLARWGRTFSSRWFHYHWWIMVSFSVPTISLGWALGFLAVAEHGVAHGDSAHKLCGILLYMIYLAQLCLGTFVHFRKPPYLRRHPPRNIAHGILGTIIIGLAFYETRTGITDEWQKTNLKPINLEVLSNIWIAWTVFIPLLYFSGFFLLRRQLAYEKELPPPYTFESRSRINARSGMRRLLGLEPEDDGTHDVFSERRPRNSGIGESSVGVGIEMREVNTDLGISLSRTV